MSEGCADIRRGDALKGLNDTDAERVRACSKGRDEEEASVDMVGIHGSGGGAVRVWVECRRLGTANTDVGKKGSIRKIRSGERENGGGSSGKEKVGDGLVTAELEKVVKKRVTL